ncbi:fimbrial protein [Pseudomonas protegens]|uniref:fimbrial protein n=1 Tax=Pseudomonas protegens TaxID=380021 RepID=UPI001C8D6588|nr:fimbrial protein [Pseudomonas protegens]QZI68313.1 type 1 fimbrial protein [Pseudomonas protegens]WOE82075.1 fimbrial protein [Pseudomonas protegens]
MKKTVIALALIATVQQVQAAEVKFIGEIVDETCSLEVNGVTNPTIMLPSVSKKDLAAIGQTAGESRFTLTLKGCTGAEATRTIAASFLPNGDVTKDGRLANEAPGGSNKVSLQLLDETTPINLASGELSRVTLVEEGESTQGVSKVLGVRYYAEASGLEATAVESSMQYSISYL